MQWANSRTIFKGTLEECQYNKKDELCNSKKKVASQKPKVATTATRVTKSYSNNASSSNKCQEHLFQIQPCLN